MKTWENHFECRDCLAQIVISDERIEWQTHPKEMIERAEAYVDGVKSGDIERDTPAPPLAVSGLFGSYELDKAYERWVTCPACDGQAFPAKAPEVVMVEEE